jgi:glutathione S-transferase
MKLYYVPMTRSTRPRWLLEELGVPYDLVRLDVAAKENRRAEYLALNPLGHVPTLVDGDRVIYETLAICLYLSDRFLDRGLAPALDAPERAAYLQWMAFATATAERAVEDVHEQIVGTAEEDRQPRLVEKARLHFREAAGVLDQALEGRSYLVGERFGTADLMVGSVLNWARTLGLLGEHPRLDAYAKEQIARPACRRARAD